jgi:hypothetical protein
MKHLYLALNCRTPACGTAMLVKYIGPDIGQKEVGDLVPTGFEYECGRCTRTHRYLREELYPFRTDSAPPKGFENPF